MKQSFGGRQWSREYRFSELLGGGWTVVPYTPGTYIVRAHRPLHRAHGIDDYGILTIGKTSSLRSRLQSFWRCANKKDAQGHMAGWRFAYYNLGAKFPVENLLMQWSECEDEPSAKRAEAELLRLYIDSHGEQPPLNFAASW